MIINRSTRIGMLFLVLATANFHAAATDSEPNDSELSRVVRQTLEIYKENGLSGLIALSQDCFNTPKPSLRCVQIDIAASRLDAVFAASMGIHQHPYYEPDSFFKRATPVFVSSGLNMQQANNYLTDATEEISHLISVQTMERH